MKRLAIIAAVLLIAVQAMPSITRGQSAPMTANYAAGWNMVGGPTGTDFSPAVSLLVWTGTAYATAPSSRSTLCTGYWAYFNSPATVSIPAGSTGPSQTCVLFSGWTLVGNPFSGIATLPSDVLAYYWNAALGRYDIVHAIPPGGAAWIYSTSATTIILQYTSVTTPTATASPTSTPMPTATATSTAVTLTISDITSGGPYRVHVGDSIMLVLPSISAARANSNPFFLRLDGAGITGPLTCSGDPSCALSFENSFWTWTAIRPGTTFITVDEPCSNKVSACYAPVQNIEIDIVP